ncbi:MAG: IS1595 family transposase, partial [Burkholderiales bacterium]
RGAGSGYKANKTVVFGMVERGGDVVTEVISSRHGAKLVPHIEKHVKPGTEVHTDEFGAYDRLVIKGFDHKRVNHRAGEYVREGVGVNTIEGFWAQLKRTISGTHIHVSGKHLWKYAKEAEFRFNRRERPEAMLAELLSSHGPLKPQSD